MRGGTGIHRALDSQDTPHFPVIQGERSQTPGVEGKRQTSWESRVPGWGLQWLHSRGMSRPLCGDTASSISLSVGPTAVQLVKGLVILCSHY